MTVAAARTRKPPGPARPRSTRDQQGGHPNLSPPPPPRLDDTWAAGPPFRLVLPRDKRDRLAARSAGLPPLRACSVVSCGAQGMPVLLVDSELEAVLCPIHQLVLLNGSAVEGQPMVITTAW